MDTTWFAHGQTTPLLILTAASDWVVRFPDVLCFHYPYAVLIYHLHTYLQRTGGFGSGLPALPLPTCTCRLWWARSVIRGRRGILPRSTVHYHLPGGAFTLTSLFLPGRCIEPLPFAAPFATTDAFTATTGHHHHRTPD